MHLSPYRPVQRDERSPKTESRSLERSTNKVGAGTKSAGDDDDTGDDAAEDVVGRWRTVGSKVIFRIAVRRNADVHRKTAGDDLTGVDDENDSVESKDEAGNVLLGALETDSEQASEGGMVMGEDRLIVA